MENSASAFDAAIGSGLGIECDVQQSADGQAIVFHDWELDRLTSERGLVRDRASEALTRLRLGESRDCVPTLIEVLEQVRGRVPLLLEIKSRRDVPMAGLCLAVRKTLEGYGGCVAVMSFDPRVILWFAKHAPQVVRGLVVTEEGKRGARAAWQRHCSLRYARAEFLAYDVRDLPSRFAAAQRRRGVPLLTWTVQTPELRARAAIHADAAIAEGAGLA